jgi:hypothetical protein
MEPKIGTIGKVFIVACAIALTMMVLVGFVSCAGCFVAVA